MAFYIDTYSLPEIKTYEEAKHQFTNTHPVRGEHQSVRRLGYRQQKEKWLKQEIIEGIEVYIAGYYATELVRYYPSHMEITLGCYASVSTKLFVQKVAGVWFKTFYHKDWVPSPFTNEANKEIECELNTKQGKGYINLYDSYRINYDGTLYESDNYLTPREFKVDRKLMKEVRNKYRPYLKYAESMWKLTEGKIDVNDIKDSYHKNNHTSILDTALDENQWWDLHKYLMKQVAVRWWDKGQAQYVYTYSALKRYVDKLIKLNNPQVLVEVKPTETTLPIGSNVSQQ